MGRRGTKSKSTVAKKRRTNIKPLVGTGSAATSFIDKQSKKKGTYRKGGGEEDEFEAERRGMEERFRAKEYKREEAKSRRKKRKGGVDSGKVMRDNEIIGVDRRGMEERIMGLGDGMVGGPLSSTAAAAGGDGGVEASGTTITTKYTVNKEINDRNKFALLDDDSSSSDEEEEGGEKSNKKKIVRNPFNFTQGTIIDPDL
mmetsp:Transcript_4802/g.9634  ORF Transcript_4802/g.9634 Transcript_4802/m.9634 type:complete len:200 (-) Transcript_4802:5-604(-)